MSGVLLDTHVALQVLRDDPRLGQDARALMSTAMRTVVSTASLWELAIKHAVGKFPDPRPVHRALLDAGAEILPVLAPHVLAIGSVDVPHKDPLDRLLMAQARVEGLALLTSDAALLATRAPGVIDARA